jgi:carboxyl-terminal processing protease
MVNSTGDPYTTFFEPPENKKFQEEISGSFSGVGIEISKKSGVLTVISPIKGTPAEKAGIKAGDKILKIDSKATQDLSVDEAVSMIRGKRGTTVTLTILPNSGDFRDIPLVRDNIKIPTVDVSYFDQGGKRIAYIRIYSFNQIVDDEFKTAARDIINSESDKIILDLRNNPGGLLNSAINIAGWFLTKGQIVVTEDYGNGKSDVYRADGNALLKLPMVILINGGSASASEILAGALHDNRGIKLIGEKSFGKGSVQELNNFADGSALKVTIARWLTPAGISISKTGIEADVKVELPKDTEELNAIEIGKQGKDPQLDKALELLK